jgi:hypothetical protein
VLKVQVETLALQVLKGLLDLKDQKVPQVLKVIQVHKVVRERLDHRAQEVLRVHREHKVL